VWGVPWNCWKRIHRTDQTVPRYELCEILFTHAFGAEMGIDATSMNEFVVLENTESVRNLVVCTLCSCYPRPILGRPPDWYKSFNYRSRAVNDPRGVLREFGQDLADSVEVRVHDSTADIRYLVLPLRPPGTEGMSKEDLAKLVTRDSLLGAVDPLPAIPRDSPH